MSPGPAVPQHRPAGSPSSCASFPYVVPGPWSLVPGPWSLVLGPFFFFYFPAQMTRCGKRVTGGECQATERTQTKGFAPKAESRLHSSYGWLSHTGHINRQRDEQPAHNAKRVLTSNDAKHVLNHSAVLRPLCGACLAQRLAQGCENVQ